MIDLQMVPRKDDSFSERELGGETIFLSPEGDRIHSLDKVGTFIWKQIDGSITLGEILNLLCDEFDVSRDQAEIDLLAFAAELSENKLLVTV